MYTKEWFWYLERPDLAGYYRRQVLVWRDFLIEKPRSTFSLFRQLDHILKDIRMTANESAKKRKTSKRYDTTIRWLNVPINDENIEECLKWLDDNSEQCMGFVCAIASQGFSVSVKPGKDDDYMASIYGDVLQGDDKQTIGLSAFSDTPLDALQGVLFKFIYILDFGKNVSRGDDTIKPRFR